MTRMTCKSISAAALCAALFLTSAQAQTPKETRAKIPFEFTAGDKVLPAGTYSFSENGGPGFLTLKSVTDTKTLLRLRIVTRLSRDESSRAGRLVFDKSGDKSVLSEVWPAEADGILVYGSKGEHKHQTVTLDSK